MRSEPQTKDVYVDEMEVREGSLGVWTRTVGWTANYPSFFAAVESSED